MLSQLTSLLGLNGLAPKGGDTVAPEPEGDAFSDVFADLQPSSEEGTDHGEDAALLTEEPERIVEGDSRKAAGPDEGDLDERAFPSDGSDGARASEARNPDDRNPNHIDARNVSAAREQSALAQEQLAREQSLGSGNPGAQASSERSADHGRVGNRGCDGASPPSRWYCGNPSVIVAARRGRWGIASGSGCRHGAGRGWCDAPGLPIATRGKGSFHGRRSDRASTCRHRFGSGHSASRSAARRHIGRACQSDTFSDGWRRGASHRRVTDIECLGQAVPGACHGRYIAPADLSAAERKPIDRRFRNRPDGHRRGG